MIANRVKLHRPCALLLRCRHLPCFRSCHGRRWMRDCRQLWRHPWRLLQCDMKRLFSKSFRTWSHTKIRPAGCPEPVPSQAGTSERAAANRSRHRCEVQTPAKPNREITPRVEPAAVRDEYADWLVQDKTGSGAARITDFASRRSHDNRKACRARHDAIVRVFAINHARVLADRPVMFQSSICTANGEIVITCFGTTTTLSPRKARPSGRCRQPG